MREETGYNHEEIKAEMEPQWRQVAGTLVLIWTAPVRNLLSASVLSSHIILFISLRIIIIYYYHFSAYFLFKK
jgi:hypothetical protein